MPTWADLAGLKTYDLERLQLGRRLASLSGKGDVQLRNCFAGSRTDISDTEGHTDEPFHASARKSANSNDV